MKVIHLLSSTGLFGAENMVFQLLRELGKGKSDVYLGILENKNDAHLIIAKEAKRFIKNVKIFPCIHKFDLKSLFMVRKFIKDNKIELIHSHKYKTNFYSLLVSYTLSRKIVLIATCHNWISGDFKMRIYEWLDKKILNKFDRVVAVSDEVRKKILKSGIAIHKTMKIRNGINLKKYSKNNDREMIRNEFGISDNQIVIGYIGRLAEPKGISYLLIVLKELILKYESIKLLIVGDGQLGERLREDSEALGIMDKVIFTGFRSDIPSILSALDIFVLPSFIEGLPMVLLEAMASRKPVIATSVGDIPYVITNNESGMLVQPGNKEQLKNAILHLIENRDQAVLIAQNGYEKVRSEYSSDIMAINYMMVYNDVLQNKKTDKMWK